MQIKPGITADGFRTAVRDYTEPTVVEELGANAYDADATTLLVLLDGKNGVLHLLDNGIGFTQEAFASVATLGAGTKREIPYSKGERHYLGSYGYGLKSTLNVATKVEITSQSRTHRLEAMIDWHLLDDALRPDFTGFPCASASAKSSCSGTYIKLYLKNPTTKSHLDRFGEVLSNLPGDGGKFRCYYGLFSDVARDLPPSPKLFAKLDKLCGKFVRKDRVKLTGESLLADLDQCAVHPVKDRSDKTVEAKIYFAGLDGEKVNHLKPGLRGIYVRVHGRLLKQSFTDSQFTYPISKWKKFESGTRVELKVDWLRDQISLSREGVRFSSDKLRDDFKGVLVRCITGFIQPQLKTIARSRLKRANKQGRQRAELVQQRVKNKRELLIPGLKDGFVFRPETDGELALVISQPDVQKKVFKDLRLLDYNEQAPYDCTLYDAASRSFIKAELEPTLRSFVAHNEKKDVELIICWTVVGWKIGALKKEPAGVFKLVDGTTETRGRYRLLEFATSKSKLPRKEYDVIVVSEAMER